MHYLALEQAHVGAQRACCLAASAKWSGEAASPESDRKAQNRLVNTLTLTDHLFSALLGIYALLF